MRQDSRCHSSCTSWTNSPCCFERECSNPSRVMGDPVCLPPVTKISRFVSLKIADFGALCCKTSCRRNMLLPETQDCICYRCKLQFDLVLQVPQRALEKFSMAHLLTSIMLDIAGSQQT